MFTSFSRTQKALIVCIALLVVAAGASVYLYQELVQLKQDPQRVAREETRAVVNRVARLIVLPPGEEPTIATVTDPERLKNQPFFTNAKKGDKVLIYTNARKAILYDPASDKIIEVAPINIGSPAAPSPTPPPSTPEESAPTGSE